MKLATFLLAVVFAAGGLTGCGGQTADGRPQVVASIFPLYEAAAKIGGKHVHAVNLLPNDPYASVPAKEEQQLRDASLAIVLGGGHQPEIEKIVAQRSKPTLRILGDGEFHAAGDANIWLDPRRMAGIAEQVRDALVSLDSSVDGKFAKNLKQYEADIAKVDADYVDTLATCKASTIMVERAEFGALTKRYDLHQVSTEPLTIPIDPAVAASIEQSGVTTVFAPTIPSLRDATRIRDAYGVRVAVLDPIKTQTDQARRGGASYRVLMDLNLDALRAALDCAPKEHKT